MKPALIESVSSSSSFAIGPALFGVESTSHWLLVCTSARFVIDPIWLRRVRITRVALAPLATEPTVQMPEPEA